MAYPAVNESLYSLKQLQIAAKARSDPGVHLLMTNGLRSLKSDGTAQPHVIAFQKGLLPGTVVTYVLYYHDTDSPSKFRVSRTIVQETTGTYIEMFMEKKAMTLWYEYEGLKYSQLAGNHTANVFVPGVVVFQLDVTQDGVMLLENGDQTIPKRITGDYSQSIYHGCNEEAFCGPTIIELHKTYKADPSTIFDMTNAFGTPENVPISAGGFVMIDGSVSSACTVTYNNKELFKKSKKTEELHLLIKFYTTKALVSEEGESGTSVNEIGIPSIDYTTELTVHPIIVIGVKMKNFVMESGLIGITWPK